MNRLLLLAIALLLIAIAALGVLLLGAQPDVEELAGDVLADLSAGRYEQVWEASSPEFQARYPAERFRAAMGELHADLGAFVRIVSRREAGAGPEATAPVVGEGATFDVEYEKGAAFCYVVFDTEASPPRLAELLLRKAP